MARRSEHAAARFFGNENPQIVAGFKRAFADEWN